MPCRFVFRRVSPTAVRSAIGRQPSTVNTSGSDSAAKRHLGEGHAPFLACPYWSTSCIKVIDLSQTQDNPEGSFQLTSSPCDQLRLLLDVQNGLTSPSAHPTPQVLSPTSCTLNSELESACCTENLLRKGGTLFFFHPPKSTTIT